MSVLPKHHHEPTNKVIKEFDLLASGTTFFSNLHDMIGQSMINATGVDVKPEDIFQPCDLDTSVGKISSKLEGLRGWIPPSGGSGGASADRPPPSGGSPAATGAAAAPVPEHSDTLDTDSEIDASKFHTPQLKFEFDKLRDQLKDFTANVAFPLGKEKRNELRSLVIQSYREQSELQKALKVRMSELGLKEEKFEKLWYDYMELYYSPEDDQHKALAEIDRVFDQMSDYLFIKTESVEVATVIQPELQTSDSRTSTLSEGNQQISSEGEKSEHKPDQLSSIEASPPLGDDHGKLTKHEEGQNTPHSSNGGNSEPSPE